MRESSADEMVREFVLGEITSDRARRMYPPHDPTVAAYPADDAGACAARACWLRVARGWPDHFLFQGFPADTAWRWAELDGSELIYLSGYHIFVSGTRGTRLPADFAPDDETVRARSGEISPQHRDEYLSIAHSAMQHRTTINDPGRIVPPCIYVATGRAGPLIALEGHARVIARSMRSPRVAEQALVGMSPSMDLWGFYCRNTVPG